MGEQQTADALIEAIDSARDRFLGAIAVFDGVWNTPPADGEWSPQQIARHVFENDYFFAGQIASVLGIAPPDAMDSSFASRGAAVDALHAAATSTRPTLQTVTDDDLYRPWQDEMSLAMLLTFYAEHTCEHVAQLRVVSVPLGLAS